MSIRRARKEGKWLGETPVGFERNDEGYLRPLISPGDRAVYSIRNTTVWTDSIESILRDADEVPGEWRDDTINDIANGVLYEAVELTQPSDRRTLDSHHVVGRVVEEDQ